MFNDDDDSDDGMIAIIMNDINDHHNFGLISDNWVLFPFSGAELYQRCKWTVFGGNYVLICKKNFSLIKNFRSYLRIMMIDQPTNEGDKMAHDLTHHPDILQKQALIFVSGTFFIWF